MHAILLQPLYYLVLGLVGPGQYTVGEIESVICNFYLSVAALAFV